MNNKEPIELTRSVDTQEPMHTWLIRETQQVGWKGFFTFKKDADSEILDNIERQFGSLARDYKAFVNEFGETRLFRRLDEGSYNMAVFSRPRCIEGRNGVMLLEIGFYLGGGYAHFRKLPGSERPESSVFEGSGLQLRNAGASFEQWFKRRFEAAKALYGKRAWKRVVEGALPFTVGEIEIINAMKHFSFERIGLADNGDLLISIHNGSKARLEHLTVGVRVKNR